MRRRWRIEGWNWPRFFFLVWQRFFKRKGAKSQSRSAFIAALTSVIEIDHNTIQRGTVKTLPNLETLCVLAPLHLCVKKISAVAIDRFYWNRCFSQVPLALRFALYPKQVAARILLLCENFFSLCALSFTSGTTGKEPARRASQMM